MEDYPSNSLSAKPKQQVAKTADKAPDKHIQKVAVNGVVRRKKPLGKRVVETFFGGEDRQSVGNYILTDVMLPAAKDMVADAVSQGIERMLFGESRNVRSRPTGNRSYGGASSHVSYNRYAPNSARKAEPIRMTQKARAQHNFDDIVLETRVEADETLDALFTLVSEYEQATVADLYQLVGITPDYTDEKWGWVDLRGSSVARIKGGYLLDLPRPDTLD